MEITRLERMAAAIADYVEKRTRIPFCRKDVMVKLSAEEIRFYFTKIFGGRRNG